MADLKQQVDDLVTVTMQQLIDLFDGVEGMGERMTFMDDPDITFPYSHFTSLPDDEANERIRQCFAHAFNNYTQNALTSARTRVVKTHVFDWGLE